MIEINIDPNIARIGPFLLAWHGVFSAIGIFLGVWLPGRLLAEEGVTDLDTFYPVAWWAVAGGIVGARLLFVLEHLATFAANPLAIVKINEGGISVFGSFIGGAIVGSLMAVRRGIPLGRFADAAAPGMALGQAVGRIGDIINGEHWGKPWNGPLAVVYTNPNTLGQRGVPVHLAVGYELVLDLVLMVVLLRLYRRRFRPGMVFWLFFLGYSLIRIAIGFFRQDSLVAWGLGQAQLVGVLSIPIALAMLLYLSRRSPHPVEPGGAPGDEPGEPDGAVTEEAGITGHRAVPAEDRA
jgi:phosphatidylglycerol:prolipoprotein diacylglycerol transferase